MPATTARCLSKTSSLKFIPISVEGDYLRGRGRVRNILMVELLEGSDDLDLLLDFGEEFKFVLKTPNLQVGKVFAPNVKSAFRFTPAKPWNQLSQTEYANILSNLRRLADGANAP